MILFEPQLKATSDDAGVAVSKYELPPPPRPGPYALPALPATRVPSLSWLCLRRLAESPQDAHHIGVRLHALGHVKRDILATPAATLHPAFWAAVVQVYANLPPHLEHFSLPLSDPHVLVLQQIPPTPLFSLLTVLDLPACPHLTDASIVTLKALHSLAAFDASATTLSSYAIQALARTLTHADAHTRGPWSLRILRLRYCKNINNDVYPHLSRFPLLSVVDIRGTSCSPSSAPPFLYPAPPSHLSLYHPAPLLAALLSLSSPPLYSSPNPHALVINSLYHPAPSPTPSTVAPQDSYVVIPSSTAKSLIVGDTEALQRRTEQKEDNLRHEANKEAWYDRNPQARDEPNDESPPGVRRHKRSVGYSESPERFHELMAQWLQNTSSSVPARCNTNPNDVVVLPPKLNHAETSSPSSGSRPQRCVEAFGGPLVNNSSGSKNNPRRSSTPALQNARRTSVSSLSNLRKITRSRTISSHPRPFGGTISTELSRPESQMDSRPVWGDPPVNSRRVARRTADGELTLAPNPHLQHPPQKADNLRLPRRYPISPAITSRPNPRTIIPPVPTSQEAIDQPRVASSSLDSLIDSPSVLPQGLQAVPLSRLISSPSASSPVSSDPISDVPRSVSPFNNSAVITNFYSNKGGRSQRSAPNSKPVSKWDYSAESYYAHMRVPEDGGFSGGGHHDALLMLYRAPPAWSALASAAAESRPAASGDTGKSSVTTVGRVQIEGKQAALLALQASAKRAPACDPGLGPGLGGVKSPVRDSSGSSNVILKGRNPFRKRESVDNVLGETPGAVNASVKPLKPISAVKVPMLPKELWCNGKPRGTSSSVTKLNKIQLEMSKRCAGGAGSAGSASQTLIHVWDGGERETLRKPSREPHLKRSNSMTSLGKMEPQAKKIRPSDPVPVIRVDVKKTTRPKQPGGGEKNSFDWSTWGTHGS